MEKIKENVVNDFTLMISTSWTYDKMLVNEKHRLLELLNDVRTNKCLKGTYEHRWDILQAIYDAYLIGLGYTDFNWREEV